MSIRVCTHLVLLLARASGGFCLFVGLARTGEAEPSLASANPPAERTVAVSPVTSRIRIQFTGNRNGMIRQCDCKSYVGGGIDRELTLVKTLARDGLPMIRVDSGGFTDSAGGELARLKTAYSMQGLEKLRLDAINVYASDLDLGVASLRRAAERYSLPLISANLRARDTGALIFPPSQEAVVRAPSGRELARVGIVGVTPEEPPNYPPRIRILKGLPGDPLEELTSPTMTYPEQPVPREYTTAPMEESLRTEVERLRSRCSLIIALTPTGIDGARELVQRVPGIDVLVAGFEPTHDADANAATEGSTRIVTPGIDDVWVGDLLVDLDAQGHAASMTGTAWRLIETWPYDPDMVAVYEASVIAMDEAMIVKANQVVRRPFAYAGVASCRDCHPSEYATWKTSSHADAMETLARSRDAWNPLCLSCHSTGYCQPGGFQSSLLSSGLDAVQCESCHGPARDHVTWAYRDWRIRFTRSNADDSLGKEARVLPRRPTVTGCRSCHTTGYAPGFDVYRALEAVSGSGGTLAHNLSSFDKR